MIVFVLAALLSLPVQAELSSEGEVRIETRAFSDDDNSSTVDANTALAAKLTVKNSHGSFTEKLQVFSRTDREDPTRDVFIIEEAYWGWEPGNFQFLVGSQILNWSATEAFHPADIINSRNFDSNFENAEKIGEPMVSAGYLLDNGAINFYYMPVLTRPISPGPTNRLSFVSPGFQVTEYQWVEEDGVISDDEFHPQYAAKFDYTIDSVDLSFHIVDHIDRSQPTFQVLSATDLRAYFLPVTQYGATLQGAFGSWLTKIEYAYRDFKDLPTLEALNSSQEDHHQLAVGVEFGFEHDSAKDTTFIVEHQRLHGLSTNERANASVFQSDVLIGYRLAFNDVNSKELFISVIFDTERSHEYLYNLNYSQRLGGAWTIKTGVRAIDAPVKENLAVGLERLHESNQVYLDLSRHF